MMKIKLIPSYESIIVLFLENYAKVDIDQQKRLEADIFIPMAIAADKYINLLVETEE